MDSLFLLKRFRTMLLICRRDQLERRKLEAATAHVIADSERFWNGQESDGGAGSN